MHSLVDDHSRLACSEILPDEKGPTCAAFLIRAAGYFAEHGITRIERLIPDNAWAYRYSLRQACKQLQTEWAYRQTYTTNAERSTALAPWPEHYNTQRRHSAPGGLPPISRPPPT